MQVCLGAIPQFDKPKTLGGVEPEYLGVENIWSSAWWLLKVARLGRRLEKDILRSITTTFSASLAMVSVLAHDVLAQIESAYHLPKDNLRRATQRCQMTICSQNDGLGDNVRRTAGSELMVETSGKCHVTPPSSLALTSMP
ncbi:hypothetical protein [Mesorhizobium australicum]|uniref:hypothetical protein n=1 Tax=Mesorhizobium australicum TaxID=536018 RepID=UPI000A1CD2AC|nr:hypothetical protein [Mesorhizobium australicum]